MRISRLPSFTSTLSSDQTQPQDIFTPPLPVSVVVHSESHQDLILRRDNLYPDGYPFVKKDIYPHHDQDVRLLQPQDDKESAFPSPTLSNFSCAYSRDTCITTPCGSFPTSPASATFAPPCLAENIALPSSPEVDRTFFSETDAVSVEGDGISCPLSPSHTVLPSSRSVSVSRASPASSFPSSVVALPLHRKSSFFFIQIQQLIKNTLLRVQRPPMTPMHPHNHSAFAQRLQVSIPSRVGPLLQQLP